MGLLDAFRGAWSYVTVPQTPPVFEPSYEEPLLLTPDGKTYPFANKCYFADAVTADWVIATFGPARLVRMRFTVGPLAVINGNEPDPTKRGVLYERFVEFEDGCRVNAGWIAYTYRNNAVAGFMRYAHDTGIAAAKRYIDLKRKEWKMGMSPGYEEAAISSAEELKL